MVHLSKINTWKVKVGMKEDKSSEHKIVWHSNLEDCQNVYRAIYSSDGETTLYYVLPFPQESDIKHSKKK